MRHLFITLISGSMLLFLSACGGGSNETAPAKSTPPAKTSAADDVREIVITPVGNEMKYAVESFEVKTGQKVRVVMKNTATLEAMVHNVVICKPNTNTNDVGMAALQAGEAAGYIPQSDAILFHTGLAKPGETKMVEFTAPAPGEYPYICTFPGHWSLMKGVMKVTE